MSPDIRKIASDMWPLIKDLDTKDAEWILSKLWSDLGFRDRRREYASEKH